ncbi:MAG: hypothetical protein ACM3Y9_01230 [Ignavibacteria bacterium]
MHRVRSSVLGIALAALSGVVLAQSGAVPETLEVFEISDSDALQKMRSCNPRVKPESLERMQQRLAKNESSGVSSLLEPGDRAAVVEKGGLWMCVQMSPQRYPVLPIDAISSLLRPEGADPERVKAFSRSIAAALAETGFARALVPLAATGSAYVVFAAVTTDSPGIVAIEARPMKKGEYDPGEYVLKLDDPNVKSLAVAGSPGSSQRDIFAGRYPSRKVVDGFLIRKGNDLTRRFSFAGTVWKSPTALSTTYSFQKEGVVVFRSKASTSFGSWKVNDGVLYFDINKYSYYSALLDEQGYLNAEARNSARTPNGGTAENRFKPRFFQEGDVAAEKAAREKLDAAYKVLQMLIDARRNEILGESAEEEQRNDPATKKRQSLCGIEILPAVLSIVSERDEKLGEFCRSYTGTRAEWKASVLKDGCQGRCLPF